MSKKLDTIKRSIRRTRNLLTCVTDITERRMIGSASVRRLNESIERT